MNSNTNMIIAIILVIAALVGVIVFGDALRGGPNNNGGIEITDPDDGDGGDGGIIVGPPVKPPDPPIVDPEPPIDPVDPLVDPNEDGDPTNFGVLVTTLKEADAGLTQRIRNKNEEIADKLARFLIGRFGNNVAGLDGVGAIFYISDECNHNASYHPLIENCNVYQKYSTVGPFDSRPNFIREYPYTSTLTSNSYDADGTFNTIINHEWKYTTELLLSYEIENILNSQAFLEEMQSGVTLEKLDAFAVKVFSDVIALNLNTTSINKYQYDELSETPGSLTSGFTNDPVTGNGKYDVPEPVEWYVSNSGRQQDFTDLNNNGRWDANDTRSEGFIDYLGNIKELTLRAMKEVGSIKNMDSMLFAYEDINDADEDPDGNQNQSVFVLDADKNPTAVLRPDLPDNYPMKKFDNIKSVVVFNKTDSALIPFNGLMMALNADVKCQVILHYRVVTDGVASVFKSIPVETGEYDEDDNEIFRDILNVFSFKSVNNPLDPTAGDPVWEAPYDESAEGEFDPDEEFDPEEDDIPLDEMEMVTMTRVGSLEYSMKPFISTLGYTNQATFKQFADNFNNDVNGIKTDFNDNYSFTAPINRAGSPSTGYQPNIVLTAAGDYVEFIFQPVPVKVGIGVLAIDYVPKISLYMMSVYKPA